ncbi:Mitochondrial RNA-splicing protein MRS4 [Hanseniaspora osmophila]|uniref:Mitochondrial RNA-splicing protein MRS4 n=1 Tax=Hanseniaspora osmophila TaxID=56408 RepID=A0A1E5RNQ4_9ASCO|nr:Mitochondrial RNA-splicing protein MRS4 [Hanseniaspora osmophila]
MDYTVAEEIDYEALPSNSPLSHQLMAGAFAGVMEHSIMFPIDAIKTRMQALATASASASSAISASKLMQSGIIRTITSISTQEGSLALWKGVQSVILGAGPAHAVYFATYETVKDKISQNNKYSIPQPIVTGFSGICATIAADALMNPFDTIKQRMQLQTGKKRSKISNNERVNSISSPTTTTAATTAQQKHVAESIVGKDLKMMHVASRIYKNEGFLAFYYSYPTTIAMNIPFAALNFSIYEASTQYFNPSNVYNPWIHCLCGGISGAICAAVTTPLDCIKTVLQVRGSDSVTNDEFKKADTFKKASNAIYKNFGYKGFWRGLKPRIISNMPATAISWTAYECAKNFFSFYDKNGNKNNKFA